MTLRGDLSINRYGAAVYSIPLTMPSGPGRLSPELAVVYNSYAGHGLLGYAWQLSGLSRLHRCVSVPSLHGVRRGIFFSEQDSLCLDGQFLQELSQSPLGQTEYRTQPDQFIRILADRQQDPHRFTVHTKPGLILEFGARQQARIERDDAHGKRRILAWLLSRIRDRSGNQVDFHYRRTGHGETLIDFIRYGPNRVRFYYRKKARPLNVYTAGVPVTQEHLLSRMDVQIEQTVVRSYRFSYNPWEQLQEVQECAAQACRQAVQFEWQQPAPWRLQNWGEIAYLRTDRWSHQRYRSGDFNGDGLSDLYEVFGPGNHQASVHLNQGDGSFQQYDGPWHRLDRHDDFDHFFTADFNGDGLSDIYHFHHQDEDVVYLAHSENDALRFNSIDGVRRGRHADRPLVEKQRCLHSRCFRIADFNGDGRADVYHIRLAADADAIYLSDGEGGYREVAGIVSNDGHGGAAAMQTDRIRIADFNGDGRADIYFIKPEAGLNDLIFLNAADGRYRRIQGIQTAVNLAHDHGAGLSRIRLGDFNGDGLSDVYYVSHRDENDLIYLSHGDGQYTRRKGAKIERAQSGDAFALAVRRMRFADLNGDGRTDLYLINNRTDQAADAVYQAQTDGSLVLAGSGLPHWLSGRSSEQNKRIALLTFSDFNGDGALDLLRLPYADRQLTTIYTSPRHVHLLKQIRTALGGLSLIDYHPLPQASFHDRAAAESYPIVRTPPAVYVVGRVHHGGGSDDVSEYYRYQGVKLNVAGDGFLGFDQLEQRRHNGLIAQRSVYRLDFPWQGMLVRQQERVLTETEQNWDGGRPVSDSSYSYEQVQTLHGTHFPVLRTMRHESYDDNGVPTVNTLVRYDNYDEYGNTGLVETFTSGGGEVFGEQVASTYYNDEERWILGKPETIQIRYSDGKHEDLVRQTRFEYDENTGLLQSKTIEPGHELQQTERYRYDDFGNLITTTASVLNDAENRLSRRQYDEQGRFVVRTVNAMGHAESYLYDPRFAQAAQITDANGHVTQRRHDDWGRLIGERRADGSVVDIRYLFQLPDHAPRHAAYAVITEAHGFPKRTSYYDHHHRALREEKEGFDGRSVRRDRIYDAFGRRTRESFPYYADEEPVWTDLHYDVQGRLIKKSWPLNGIMVEENVIYDGLRTAYANESGMLRWLQYDAQGRVVRIDEPLDAQIEFEYDAAGRLLSIRDADHDPIIMNYDLFGRMLGVLDPNRGERRFDYNAWGEMAAETDANGNRFVQTHDALGRLRQRTSADGSARWVYDEKPNAIGKLVRQSFNGSSQAFDYDAYGRLAATADHRGYRFTWHYDRSGRLLRIAQPAGFIVERLYNRYGYLEAVRSPGLAAQPSLAEQAELADRWRAAARFYRLLMERMRSSEGRHYQELDDAARSLERGADRLHDSMTAPAGSFARALHCLEASRQNLNRADAWLDQAENSNDALAVSVYRAQALHRIERNDDCLQRARSLNRAEDGAFYHWRVLRRDAAGRAELERLGNDWQTERVFDPASGRPLSIRSLHQGVVKRDWHYVYDQRGNLIQRRDGIREQSQWFNYDELDRLASASAHDGKSDGSLRHVFYHYDRHGNLQFDSELGAYWYGGRQNAPHAVSALGPDHSYRYDRKGRLLGNQRLQIRWLGFDQPARIENKMNKQWLRFGYDAEHKLIHKESSHGYQLAYAGKTYRHKQGEGQDDEECHTAYAEARALVDFCRRAGSRHDWRLFYYHHDVLGSAAALSDGGGRLLGRAAYSAFGECRGECLPAVAGVRRGFGGHEQLEEVGLVHMNGRIYDPHSKQFLSPDAYQSPLYFTQAYNPYRYGLNNPFRYSDPSGYFVKSLVRKIKRAVGGAVRFVRRNARPLAAAFVGYQLGAWAGGHFLRQAAAQLIWSPGAMASGAYMAAYGEAVASSALLSGVIAGGSSGLLAGGGVRGVLVNALSGGAFARLGMAYKNQWTPGRVLAGGLISGTASALQGGRFTDGALAYLQGGTLKAAALAMRRAMIAQSSLDVRNLGASSAGFMGDGIKLGGGRYDPSATAAAPSPLGGHQGQPGLLFGRPYAPGSWQDLLVEAYAGPHDYLNSFYWYDNFGNIRPGISTAGRAFGTILDYANLAPSTPFAAASVVPDYFYALPAK